MINTNDFPNISNRVEKLCAITNNYRFEDLVRAIFCINICVNNRAVLESSLALNATLFEYVERDNKGIRSYEEFCDFFKEIEVILQATNMDDYVVEDFGDAKLVVDGKPYDIIIGNGYNQVFACVHFLQVLAQMLGKESELKSVLEYHSGIINYFKKSNLNDNGGEVRFVVPSKELFECTRKFFETDYRKYDIFGLLNIYEEDVDIIERKHFVEYEDNIYPLMNTSMLVDLFGIWYGKLNEQERSELADNGIIKLVWDIYKLEQGERTSILCPVQIFENRRPIENSQTLVFMATCKKGAIIAINEDSYKNVHDYIEQIELLHSENRLEIAEVVSRNNDRNLRGITILKECPIKYIIYNSFVNIREHHVVFGTAEDKLFRCSALDMIYYLCFTENIEELYDYLAYENDNEYEQLFGFGGDATRFLSWKMQQHMFAKGAIKFGMIDVGYDTENQYVVDYYREKLTMFPFDLRDYIFDNPFSWNIKEANNGFYEYVYKGGAGFGGNYKRYNNGCYLFFAHNLEFFIKTSTINKYKDIIHFVDELNERIILVCESVFENAKELENVGIQIMFMPQEYAETVGLDINDDSRMYVYSDMNYINKKICIRYAVDAERLYKDIENAADRSVEVRYMEELLSALKLRFEKTYSQIVDKLRAVKENLKEVDAVAIEIDYKWDNEKYPTYNVEEKAYLDVRKNIACICYEAGIEPGEYFGTEANRVIRNIQRALIEDFEKQVLEYDWKDLHCRVLDIYSTTIHEILVHRQRYSAFTNVSESTQLEVQQRIIKLREEAKHHSRSLRYLLETNQFLNRSAGKKISSEQLQYLLAYANWLVVLSDNADMCHFTEEESHIEVSFEYVVDVVGNEGRADDFSGIEKRVYNDPGYNVRDEKIDLEFIDRAKTAFKKDMGIDLLDLYDFMTYLQISFNEENAEKKGANVYKILKKELLEAYVKERRDEITIMEVGKLLRCLVMIPEQLKTCRGKTDFYLPIGEVKNRKVKFEVMPIVEIDEWVIFSPITIRDIHDRWFHGLFDFMLPYEVELEELKNVIVDWKACYEKKIVEDIEKVFNQHEYAVVRKNFEINKLNKLKYPKGLGDYDVFAVDCVHKKIWLIECKFLEKVSSFYEMYRQQNRFFNEHKEDEKFQRRIDFVNQNVHSILLDFEITDTEEYEVIPYMCMNKVLVSRYKKIRFPIVSFNELRKLIRLDWE